MIFYTRYARYILIGLALVALALAAFLVAGNFVKKNPTTTTPQTSSDSAQTTPTSGTYSYQGTIKEIGKSLAGDIVINLSNGRSQSFPLTPETQLLEGPNQASTKPSSIDKFNPGALVILTASYDAKTDKWTTKSVLLITPPAS